MRIKSISKIHHIIAPPIIYIRIFYDTLFYLYKDYNIIFAYSILFDKVKILFAKDFLLIDTSI